MRDQPEKIARVDWGKFEVEVHEPRTLAQLLSQYHGCELAIVGITVIAIAFIVTTQSELVSVPLTAIGAVLVLGLSGFSWRKRQNDATPAALPSESKAQSGYARSDQAAA